VLLRYQCSTTLRFPLRFRSRPSLVSLNSFTLASVAIYSDRHQVAKCSFAHFLNWAACHFNFNHQGMYLVSMHGCVIDMLRQSRLFGASAPGNCADLSSVIGSLCRLHCSPERSVQRLFSFVYPKPKCRSSREYNYQNTLRNLRLDASADERSRE